MVQRCIIIGKKSEEIIKLSFPELYGGISVSVDGQIKVPIDDQTKIQIKQHYQYLI